MRRYARAEMMRPMDMTGSRPMWSPSSLHSVVIQVVRL